MKSMTGYGASEGKVGKGRVFIEVRSVNHRYCDINLKIPPKYYVLDDKLRKAIQKVVGRGKVELFLKERIDVEPTPRAMVNIPLANAYERCLRELEKRFGAARAQSHLLDMIDLVDLVRIEEQPVKYEKLWNALHTICAKALEQMERMRKVEGDHLKKDQLRRLAKLERFRTQIADRAVRNRKIVQKKFADAQKKHGGSENGRNGSDAQCAALDRMDISEELTRLQSHLGQYHKFISRAGPIGRQLDFLIQEMNREINTVGSKASDAQISQLVVEAKSELEKIREQVQNIE